MTEAVIERRFRPPAPEPSATPPDLFGFLAAARSNPLETWTKVHFEKPIVYGKGVMGRVLVLNDPKAIRHVLLDNAQNYIKDDLQRRVLAPGEGEGLISAEGDSWRHLRRTLAPMFSPRNVAGFAPVMNEAAMRVVRRLTRREGRVIDMSIEMTRVTLDVLERTIFTQGLDRDPDALGRAITDLFSAIGPVDPLDVLKMPDWIPRIGRIRSRPATRFFGEIVSEITKARRAQIAAGGDVPRDILTLLLEARDPESGEPLDEPSIGANIVGFIGAGHETTANTLAWTLYLLSQSSEVLDRLRAEIDEVVGEGDVEASHLPKLVYTRAVLDESMRLYPPAPFLSREPLKEDRIAGIRVPKGTLVAIAPWVLHRHKTLWEDPDIFDPDRFLSPNREKIDRFAYLPFGAGPRVCIGQSFAMQEAMIVLARIVQSVSFSMVPGHVVRPLQRVTLRPEGGLPMRVAARKAVG
jgi:cytochrome P450